MIRSTLIVIIAAGLITGCSHTDGPMTVKSDYLFYLNGPHVGNVSAEKEMEFWTGRNERNGKDEVSLAKLASLYAARFKEKGDVLDILKSDSLYKIMLSKTPFSKAGIYQALATNSISQHQFRRAKQYIEEALKIGDKQATSKLILADVTLELGNYNRTKNILNEFVNKNSFAYLIRLSKLKDHEGHLDSAIMIMEKAQDRIKGNKALSCWTLSNLADLYGHAGRITEAYETYLKVLKINPEYHYALKGIAWVALSHDRKTTEARHIIEALDSRKRMPEAHLMLAQVAGLEDDVKEKKEQLKKFMQMVDLPAYRRMYNKYIALIEADEFNNPERCIAIAKEEIANRPTPQSYDLLEWGYYRQGNYSKALSIANRFVSDQTYEPEALYHLGMIYRASGMIKEGNEFLRRAEESAFELGPSITKIIQHILE